MKPAIIGKIENVRMIKVPRYIADIIHNAQSNELVAQLAGKTFIINDPTCTVAENTHTIDKPILGNQIVFTIDEETEVGAIRGSVAGFVNIHPSNTPKRVAQVAAERERAREKSKLAIYTPLEEDVKERVKVLDEKPTIFQFFNNGGSDEDGSDNSDFSGSDEDGERKPKKRAKKRTLEKMDRDVLRSLLIKHLASRPDVGFSLKEIAELVQQTQGYVKDVLYEVADLHSVENRRSTAKRYLLSKSLRMNAASLEDSEDDDDEPSSKRALTN